MSKKNVAKILEREKIEKMYKFRAQDCGIEPKSQALKKKSKYPA